MTQAHTYFSIGDLSKQSGVGIPTIRYYGEIGLLPSAGRSAGGHRIYGETHLKRLLFIRRSRELGFSQEDVRALLANAERREAPCAEVDRLACAQLAIVREKLAQLQALEQALEGMISACQGHVVEECSIIDALSAQAPLRADSSIPHADDQRRQGARP